MCLSNVMDLSCTLFGIEAKTFAVKQLPIVRPEQGSKECYSEQHEVKVKLVATGHDIVL